MASGDRESRRRLDQSGTGPDKESQDKDRPDLQKLEEGQELDADLAERLQPQLGNQGVQNLVGRHDSSGHATAALESQQQEGNELEEEQGEDLEEGVDFDAPQFGGGGGGGGGGPEGDPWEWQVLFGGDDDDDPATPGRRYRLRPPPRHGIAALDGAFRQDQDEKALQAGHLAPIDDRLSALVHGDPLRRQGDAVYLAVEIGLVDARRLGRVQLEPELLVDATGPLDPIGRPTSIGRFLAAAAESPHARSLAWLLSEGLALLAPEATGFSGVAARLAALAVAAEAMEGGGARTDRAVQLSLLQDAWPEAIQAARDLGPPGLRAHLIFDKLALQRGLSDSSQARSANAGGHLARAALGQMIPFGPPPDIPEFALAPTPPAPTGDEAVDAIDALLDQFTGVAPPELDPIADAARLQPVREAVDAAMANLGRLQVELGAAGGGIARVHAAPVRPMLVQADKGVRALARQVVGAAQQVRAMDGRPARELGPACHEISAALREVGTRAARLREEQLGLLAAALDAG